MFYPECKIYFDGSGYIAIPHTEGRNGPRPKKIEPLIEIIENPEIKEPESERNEPVELQQPQGITERDLIDMGLIEETDADIIALFERDEGVGIMPTPISACTDKPKGRMITRKQLFEELYIEAFTVKRSERKQYILERMKPYFKYEESAKAYVDKGFERKRHNLISRRIRLMRKIYLHGHWTHFVTFTYDDKKHSEDSFKKKLKSTLWNFTKRKGWQYVGVWERSPEKQRLHFHGLMDIPEMVGEIIEVKDYSPIKKAVQVTFQNTYFNERFGRSDFKAIDSNELLGQAMRYLVKYIEKTGEKIVYSKGLPAYFISDVNEDDILCNINDDDKPMKFLLFDDFACWDEGVYMGQVSNAVITQMRKSN